MGSKWRKAKLALGLNLCVYVPKALEESLPLSSADSTERLSNTALLSPTSWGTCSRPMTPTPSSHGLRLSRRGRKSSKTCSICLTKMKQGGGQAIFTADCSHSFHFNCITSNVKRGNQACPVCSAKWKEIPMQGPSLDPPPGRAAINPIGWPQNDALMTLVHQLPCPHRDLSRRHVVPLFQAPEPGIFNDDEALDRQPVFADRSSGSNDVMDSNSNKIIAIKSYPEVSVAPRSKSYDNFTVLIHLKVVATIERQNPSRNQATLPQLSLPPHAPVDLVTVHDISGSMAGTVVPSLHYLNLGSTDRLSIIAFSFKAHRLFPC